MIWLRETSLSKLNDHRTAVVKAIELKNEVSSELERILDFWMNETVDSENGGFLGELNNQNEVNLKAPKGAILNARILWTFSSAYRVTSKAEYMPVANRAYQYIIDHFVDLEYGGVYWSLNEKGEPLNDRKQIYAIAFTIYGLSEYYRITQKPDALKLCKLLYRSIEEHSFDPERNGYFEALTRKWETLDDVRLSDKDENALKTMNTHLHVLEAYTNLFRIWEDEGLKKSLKNLIEIHIDVILQDDMHFGLFFDENWNLSSRNASFGHDIEGSWLMYEAAEVLGDEVLVERVKDIAVRMAKVASEEGVSDDFAVLEELHVSTGEQDTNRHWWPQAEGIVGFFNAYQLSGNESYLALVTNIWKYTKSNLLDYSKGEWFWKVDPQGNPNMDEPKVGFWKCPYHNSRACLEIIERLS